MEPTKLTGIWYLLVGLSIYIDK